MADYLPITDQEIEPEAPLTSALQHKFRDNPEAIIEGATGAPRIQTPAYDDLSITGAKIAANTIPGSKLLNNSVGSSKLHVITATVNNTASTGIILNNVAVTGGIYFLNVGFQSVDTRGSRFGVCQYTKDMTNSASSIVTIFVELVDALGNNNRNINYNYVGAGTLIYSWLWFLKHKITGEYLYSVMSEHHPSFGLDEYIEHPFQNMNLDLADYDIFLVNLDASQHNLIKLGQIPLVGGGYLTEAIYNSGLFEIDYFAQMRDVWSSFWSIYDLDFTPTPWIDDTEFLIKSALEFDGGFIPSVIIPEPTLSVVNKIDVIRI